MQKNIILAITLLTLALVLFSPLSASAERPSIFNIWSGTEQTNPAGFSSAGTGTCNVVGYCTFCHSIVVVRNIINILVKFSVALAVAFLVWGALKIVISAGRPQVIQEGRKAITSAVVGLIIVLGAWVIINTLLSFIVGAGNFPWNSIQCS